MIQPGINRFGDLSGVGNLSTLLANAMQPQIMSGAGGYAFAPQAGSGATPSVVNPRAMSGRAAVTPSNFVSPTDGQGQSQPATIPDNTPTAPIAGNDSYTPMGGGSGDAQFANFPSYGLSGDLTGQYYSPASYLPANPAPGTPDLPAASADSGLPFGITPAQLANGALTVGGMVNPIVGGINAALNFANGFSQGYNGNSNTQYAIGDGSQAISANNKPSTLSQIGSAILNPSQTIGNLVGQAANAIYPGQTIDANPYADLNSNYPTGFASLVAAYGGDLSSNNPSGFDPNQAAMDANNALSQALNGQSASPYSLTGNMFDTFMQGAGFGGAGYGYGAMGNQGAWDPRFANGGWAGGDSLPTGVTT